MNSYDHIIYNTEPRPETHPAQLATIASLFGINSKSIEKARILELGAGTAGNIIPLAEQFPESSFLGIDYSQKQVELGKKTIQELGFKNIELRYQSITDFPKDSGKFDYILCHGVYSWVNSSIQDKILDIFKEHLGPNGLAYVSYNTFPGWKTKGAIREMMRYHTSNIANPEEKVAQARALLGFLIDSQLDGNDPYSQTLVKSLEELREVPSFYIFHEYLEEENQAFYFYEFISKLSGKNLNYLGDAEFSLMTYVDLPDATQELLATLDDRVKVEQYLDFIRNRKLRGSILCHGDQKVNYPITQLNFEDYYISAEFSENEAAENVFVTSSGGKIESSNPLTLAALKILNQKWPGQIKFKELLKLATDNMILPANDNEIESHIEQFKSEVYLFYSANLIELKTFEYGSSANYNSKPKASKFARYQALRQERVTSLRHKAVKLETIVAHVLSLADGIRSETDIIQELENLVKDGKLVIENPETNMSEKDFQDFLGTIVQKSLRLLAKKAFFLEV